MEELLEIILPTEIELAANNDGFYYNEPLEMGYAMKVNQKLPKITGELEAFVKNFFDSGVITNQKWTPDEIVKEIHKKFPMKEWLKWSQVKGMIGGLKAKLLAQGSKDLEDQLQEQAEDEIALEIAMKEVSQAKNILDNADKWLSSHPIEVKFIIDYRLFLMRLMQ